MRSTIRPNHVGWYGADAKSVKEAKTLDETPVNDVKDNGMECSTDRSVLPLALNDTSAAIGQESPCDISKNERCKAFLRRHVHESYMLCCEHFWYSAEDIAHEIVPAKKAYSILTFLLLSVCNFFAATI